jgi:hypothetical protein
MPKCKLCQNEAEGEAQLLWLTLATPIQPGVAHFPQSGKQQIIKAEPCEPCYGNLKGQLQPRK